MKKIAFISLVVATTFTTSALHAQTKPTVKTPTLDPVVTYVEKGKTASFSGILVSPPAGASAITNYQFCVSKSGLDLEKTKQDMKNFCDFSLKELKTTTDADKKILQSDIDYKASIIKSQEEKIKDVPNRAIWFGMGAASGIAFTLLTVFLVGQALKN